jgi:hypothetical protein
MKPSCANMTQTESCNNAIKMIDKKGFVYCESCGLRRRASLIPCRKLLKKEITQINNGQALSKY